MWTQLSFHAALDPEGWNICKHLLVLYFQEEQADLNATRGALGCEGMFFL